MNPSAEQGKIISDIKNKNVVVNSVAGCGKTTTNLHIAKHYPDYNILLLTYNSKLKVETRSRKEIMGLDNLEVHSYHSFCVKYYDRNCFTDSVIKKIMDKPPLKKFNYDIIIIDEAQDINLIYYRLIRKIYNDNGCEARLCVLGDDMQSIYSFNGADSRFITMASRVMNFNNYEWIENTLSKTYRLTTGNANFVNKCLLGYDKLIAVKQDNSKPRYLICNIFDNDPVNEVFHYLYQGYKFDDIFILAPSLRNCIISNCANRLSAKNVLIHVPVSDEEKIDDELIKNKICFSSFHQVKGLERKVVIIFNFDSSYFKYYNKTNPNVCPNEIYVATTRATEKMTLLHHEGSNYMPFIKQLKQHAYVINFIDVTVEKNIPKEISISVTNFLRMLKSDTVDKALTFLKITHVNHNLKKVSLKTKVKEESYYESVAEITGVAIPAFLEYSEKGKTSIGEIKDVSELMKAATRYVSVQSGYIFKMKQITNYDWIDNDTLIYLRDRLKMVIDAKNPIYEKRCFSDEFLLHGYIDCVDDNNVWEFKCVSGNLDGVYILQLALYMLIYHDVNKKYNLLNILTSEHIIIECDRDKLVEMYYYLLKERNKKDVISDKDFIDFCHV